MTRAGFSAARCAGPVPRGAVTLTLPRNRALELGSVTRVMGVLNVTPDSFSDGGRFYTLELAVGQARRMIAEGADVLDVGGESTRPGADAVPAEEQIRRTVPVIEEVRRFSDIPISIDTASAETAERAIEAGADMINDVTALRGDPRMAAAVAALSVPVVLMHMQGSPRTMQQSPHYGDVVGDIMDFFRERIEAAVRAGIDEGRILVDPGFGFGKKVEHNLEILRRLQEFHRLGRPLLVGTSRKSTIGLVMGRGLDDRLFGTAATVCACVSRGAHMVRVHDVGPMRDAVRMTEAIERGVT